MTGTTSDGVLIRLLWNDVYRLRLNSTQIYLVAFGTIMMYLLHMCTSMLHQICRDVFSCTRKYGVDVSNGLKWRRKVRVFFYGNKILLLFAVAIRMCVGLSTIVLEICRRELGNDTKLLFS